VSTATPDDCAAFQRKALTLPRNWRSKYPKSKEASGTITPTTVAKWSRALAAAFGRCNRNAGNKCVRGVVPEVKLLDANPWRGFSWAVEEVERPIRQFDAAELTGLLDYLTAEWPAVTAARAAVKVLFWSACRKEEVTGLTWSQYRPVHGEHHFDVTGKWGVRRWVRVPDGLFADLQALRAVGDDRAFAAYNPQLRAHHEAGRQPWQAHRVGASFSPACFGDWLYERVVGWAKTAPGGHAYLHVFRKTSLQFARDGEDVNRRVAEDAGVNENVLLGHYVREEDRHLRAKSNATFARLAAALPPAVSARLGFDPPPTDRLRDRLDAAVEGGDYDTVARLASELARRGRSSAV
jgi:integrase